MRSDYKSDRATERQTSQKNVPGPGTFFCGPLMKKSGPLMKKSGPLVKKSGPLVKKSGPHFSQNNLFCCSAHPHRLSRYSPSTLHPPPSTKIHFPSLGATKKSLTRVTHARVITPISPGKVLKSHQLRPFLKKKPKKMIRLINFLIIFATEKGRIVCGPI